MGMDSRRLIFETSSSSSSQRLLNTLGQREVSPWSSRCQVGCGRGSGGGRREQAPLSSDEIYEEYYEVLPLEKKRRLTSEQIQMLERSFEEEDKLEPERKCELAKKLELPPRQVAVWFQKHGARWKNQQLERDFDRLKASYDALLVDHDGLVEYSDQLSSQVNLLLEKLQANEQGAKAGVTSFIPDDQAASSGNVMDLNLNIQQKVDDLLSMGSDGNAAANVDARHLLADG